MPPRQLRLHTLRLSALPFFRSLLVLLVLGAYVAWQSLRANYKVRDGQLLMNILTALNELFISAQACDQLPKFWIGNEQLPLNLMKTSVGLLTGDWYEVRWTPKFGQVAKRESRS